MLLAVLVLDVDNGPEAPGELGLPDQGRVGERELTLGCARAGPTVARAPEAAVQVGGLPAGGEGPQVDQALEGVA